MPEEINITVKTAIKVVILRWNDLTADQIAELADQVWYADPATQGQADMLYSLHLCKHIASCQSLEELVELWLRIEDNGHRDGKGYGGLIHGEGTTNYRSARRFVEGLFVPVLLNAMDERFNSLAQAASRLPAGEGRISAYEEADSRLQDIANGFDFTSPWMKKIDRMRERQGTLFAQLIDAEEDEGNETGE